MGQVNDMSLEAGRIYRLVVNRITDLGYMLALKDEEVFLHVNESMHRNPKVKDTVEAFLYHDFKGRLSATLQMPLATTDRPAVLEVKEAVPGLGVFMDIGISKDILLSKDDLPSDRTLWPRPGDRLHCKLSPKGRLHAEPVMPEGTDGPEPVQGDSINGHVQLIGKEGINIVTDDLVTVFVHNSALEETVRLGQPVTATVTFVSQKGISASMSRRKEERIDDDSKTILDYLVANGSMPLDADSPPERIRLMFSMSKKAFKRALGALYKERKIVFKDGRTVLIKD
jgi:uncharacterized protein